MERTNEIQIFFRFLKDKGVFSEFFREVRNNRHSSSTINKHYGGNIKALFKSELLSPTYIDKCLHWEDTERGTGFWSHLSTLYSNYYHSVKRGVNEDLLKDE